MNLQQRYELEVARREVGVAVEREVAALASAVKDVHAG
jgi:plasmid maintenance system antidote protein VapI